MVSLFEGHIIFAPILKPHQEPIFPRDSLHHISQLLPHPSITTFAYLLLQLTYLGFYYHPHRNFVPPPPQVLMCGKGNLIRRNKN